MATQLVSITNKSNQVVPILLNSIELDKANSLSDIRASDSRQLSIPPGAELEVEAQRVDRAQLEQLQNLSLISFQFR